MSQQTIPYGNGKTLVIDPPDSVEVIRFRGPVGQPAVDTQTAVRQAIDAPTEFPPLRHAVVEGDRIVIAADPETPQLREVLTGLVDYLLEAGVRANELTIVTVDQGGDAVKAIRGVPVVMHNGDDEDSLSYLAASKDGNAIYVNRHLFDADLVLLVTALRFDRSPGYFGVHGGIFPLFSDDKTRKRFWRPDQSLRRKEHNKRLSESNEAAWLLGVQFSIQVAAGAGGSVLAVAAGHGQAFASDAESLLQPWRFEPERRADMVVASIEGDDRQQTWDSFARALSAAGNAVEDNGCIVLCTDLALPAGVALDRLAGGRGEESAGLDIERTDTADALAAAVLHDVSQRAHVYLVSQLDSQQVEDWGAAPIEDPADISRLSRTFSSCIVLEGAQFAHVQPHDHARVDQ